MHIQGKKKGNEKKTIKNPQGVFNYLLAQGISHTEQDSHRVDVEQIPLTFAPAIQRGQWTTNVFSPW